MSLTTIKKSTKEENIAFRLSGKVKNFTGTSHLLCAFSELFNSEAEILEVNEKSIQEKLSIQARVSQIAC